MCPAVSVIVATYNYGRFLPGALDSLLRQTFTDSEAVVIDDGSTDDTPEAVRPYLADPRFRYVRLDHAGQPAAKNTGVRASAAPLIAFLDADDTWAPTKLERQVELFRRDPGLGVACTGRRWVDGEGRELESHPAPLHRGNVLAEMFRDNFVCFSSCMVRREVFDTVGLFDECRPIAIDFELWLRAATHFRFDYVDEPLVNYRVGHASLSTRVEERYRTVLDIRRRFLDEQGGRRLLAPDLVREVLAGVYVNLGVVVRDRSHLAAAGCFLRALANAPACPRAWKGLGSLFLPEGVRRLVRRSLGRPADWRVRRPAPAATASH